MRKVDVSLGREEIVELLACILLRRRLLANVRESLATRAAQALALEHSMQLDGAETELRRALALLPEGR